jgi:UDP-galactopyranose mutase
MYDVLIVGAGLSGAVCARALTDRGYKVLVLERNETHGGNCLDEMRDGNIIHKYGVHIFHTNAIDIWSWISKYGEWRDFSFRAVMEHADVFYSTPFNMYTFAQFFGVGLPEEAYAIINKDIEIVAGDNAEAWSLRHLGRQLYTHFVYPQLKKHWGVEPRELPASYIARIPIRYTYDTTYFHDTIQKMPLSYQTLFDELLEGIDVKYETGYSAKYDARLIIHTGSIDEYFDYSFGVLPYRTLDFEFYQGNSLGVHMLRFGGGTPYYRCIDWGEVSRSLAFSPKVNWLSREKARDWEFGDIRMYPVRTEKSMELFNKYKKHVPYKVNFLGRLGSFQYMDMHQVIGQALKFVRNM